MVSIISTYFLDHPLITTRSESFAFEFTRPDHYFDDGNIHHVFLTTEVLSGLYFGQISCLGESGGSDSWNFPVFPAQATLESGKNGEVSAFALDAKKFLDVS